MKRKTPMWAIRRTEMLSTWKTYVWVTDQNGDVREFPTRDKAEAYIAKRAEFTLLQLHGGTIEIVSRELAPKRRGY